MSREQDQRIINLYEKVVKKEVLNVGDKLLYTGQSNKQLRGKTGTIEEVKKGLIKVYFDHIDKTIQVETPLIKKAWKKVNEEELNEDVSEGRMKELAMDLYDDVKKLEQSVSFIAKKTKKVAPKVFKHLNEALKHIGMAKTSLPVSESSTGFSNKLRGGKVPIGQWSFEYIPEDKSKLQFLINSMKQRKPNKIIKLRNSVVMMGTAQAHQSLINSLQKLSFPGEVRDWNRKEKGNVVYGEE